MATVDASYVDLLVKYSPATLMEERGLRQLDSFQSWGPSDT